MRATMTSAPRWSQDGKRIVFISTKSGQMQIYIMDAGGGHQVQVTNDSAHHSAPSWSRDGKWIYFASNRNGGFQVWKTPPEPDGPQEQVTRNGGYAALESSDGKTLYYSRRDGSDGLWTIPVAGGMETRVVATVDAWANFDVSPDGIVFVPQAPRPQPVQFYSFLTRHVRTLAEMKQGIEFGLSISPADGSIIYTRTDQDSSVLLMVEDFQ
jgi:Tol biopolymer transport system component